ncbi:hypothetical protein FS749_007905 [Ceratobasidium sp. UAMH 11750]|nr:hypothetical protein FS749_007905 [Ceratobasidium sp. UAMH 11750]
MAGTLDSNVPWLAHADSGPTLAAIQPYAAGLKHLDLFVDSIEYPPGHWANLAIALGQMVSLKILGLGCRSLCNQVLAAVGQIPGLEVLSLRFRRNAHLNLSNLHVPHGLFACLSRLVVTGAWPNHLLHLINLQPLIANIQSARLDAFEGSRHDHYLDRVLEVLQDGAKHLRDLDIFFPASLDGPYELQSSRFMHIISGITLEHVGLHNLCLPIEQPFGQFIEQCNRWKGSLQQFIMPEQTASLWEVESFAKFLRLEFLALNLQVIDVPHVREAYQKPISSRVLRMESYFLLHHLRPEAVDKLALFFLRCWKDVVLVMAGRTLQEDEQCDLLDNWVYVTLLKELARLKGRQPTTSTVKWG